VSVASAGKCSGSGVGIGVSMDACPNRGREMSFSFGA